MPVLKDLECKYCGSVTEYMLEPGTESAEYWCESCLDIRLHESLCNGGKNVTPSLAAYGGTDWTGHVRYESPSIRAGGSDNPTNVAGDSIKERVEKKREERVDKIRWKKNRNKKLYF